MVPIIVLRKLDLELLPLVSVLALGLHHLPLKGGGLGGTWSTLHEGGKGSQPPSFTPR